MSDGSKQEDFCKTSHFFRVLRAALTFLFRHECHRTDVWLHLKHILRLQPADVCLRSRLHLADLVEDHVGL